MVHIILKRKCFHLVRLVGSLPNLLKKVKRTNKQTKPKPPKTQSKQPPSLPQNQPWKVLSHMTSYRPEAIEHLQSKSKWRFTIRFVTCLHQGKNKSGQCTKMGYDLKQSLYTTVILSFANLQDLSLFRPICCTSPSCIVTCTPAFDGNIVFMHRQNILDTLHFQMR